MSGLLLDGVNLYCGQQSLFENLSLAVEPGELLQIVGDNGAGKSSLLRIMAGLLMPERGVLSWCGKAIDAKDAEFQSQLFYLGHSIGVKAPLTVLENLLYDYRLLSLDQEAALQALDRLGLYPYRLKFAGALSQGQRQRLALAKLLCCEARLLLLDEPLTALDSNSIRSFEAVLEQQLQAGAAIVVSSHQKLTFRQVECLYHVL